MMSPRQYLLGLCNSQGHDVGTAYRAEVVHLLRQASSRDSRIGCHKACIWANAGMMCRQSSRSSWR